MLLLNKSDSRSGFAMNLSLPMPSAEHEKAAIDHIQCQAVSPRDSVRSGLKLSAFYHLIVWYSQIITRYACI